MPDQEIPAGMMRVWDPVQKKILLVPAMTVGPNRITFSMRIHDAAEKQDPAKSSSWVTVEVARADLKMSQANFVLKYVLPNLAGLTQLELS